MAANSSISPVHNSSGWRRVYNPITGYAETTHEEPKVPETTHAFACGKPHKNLFRDHPFQGVKWVMVFPLFFLYNKCKHRNASRKGGEKYISERREKDGNLQKSIDKHVWKLLRSRQTDRQTDRINLSFFPAHNFITPFQRARWRSIHVCLCLSQKCHASPLRPSRQRQ